MFRKLAKFGTGVFVKPKVSPCCGSMSLATPVPAFIRTISSIVVVDGETWISNHKQTHVENVM